LKKRVVITGLGFVTSIGNSRAEVAESLRQSRSGIEVFAELPDLAGGPRLAGTIKNFSFPSLQFEDWTYPSGYSIGRNDLRSMSPHVVFAWCAMQQAIADARLGPDRVSHPRTGAACASGGSMWLTYENLRVMVTEGVHKCHPLSVPASMPGTLNANLAACFKLKGAVVGFLSACASSAHAFGFACDQIVLNRQDVVFVVGAEDCNKFSVLPFASVRALSLQTDPARAPCPFDVKRDGFVGTGGATVLVLEELESALQRGATIYSEVLGWGEASDGYNVMAPEPEGEGLARAMQNALSEANLIPADIDYINAHATGTTVGDISEIKAIRRVFQNSRVPYVSSTKALTGHGICLAGAMEAAFTTLALHERFLPISAKISQLDPACAGVPVLTHPVDVVPALALSNSSGFGGANVSIALARWPREEKPKNCRQSDVGSTVN
jgi:3-oxoacyl-[acyl-carrier-protein] synthase I